jgi:membrane-associated protease RseP (regulator of RpoE activity)
MKPIKATALALIALTGLPAIAQRTIRVQRPVVAGPMEFESSARSYLGVGVVDLDSDRIQALKLKDDHGVEISQVDQDAPAGKAGFKEHDVIVAFNGTPVESQEQFKRLMRETPPGRTVSLDIVRDGQPQKIKVQLADRKKMETTMMLPREPKEPFAYAVPPMPPMSDFSRTWTDRTIRIRSNSGATLESLTPQLGDYFGVKNGEGMLVRSVQKGSAAETAGLRAGDVVVRVGDQKISDGSDWTDALRNGKNGKVAVVIVRDKKEQTLSMSVPPRKGPDSSALYEDGSPDVEAVLEAASGAIEGVEPVVEESLENGGWALTDSLSENQVEVERSLKKTMEQIHREMINNHSEIQRSISKSMKLASASLKSQGPEITRALREAERAIKNIHIEFYPEMQ